MPDKNDRSDWIAAVARRAKVPIPRVEEVLATRSISPSPVAGTPRQLLVKSVRFSGVKEGVPLPGPFEFHWNDLQPGLWGLCTDRNFRGKSSVLAIIRWLLRGRTPSNLQGDVRNWITDAALTFQLDEILHEVVLQIVNKTNLHGQLLRQTSGSKQLLATFSDPHEFESVMSEFFMRAFSLDMVTNWTLGRDGDGGQAIQHGWPALSGVLFIGTNYTSLMGDMPPASGVPVRLLQMYLGAPWVSTLAAAKTTRDGFKRAQEQRERHRDLVHQHRQSRIESIVTTLSAKKLELERSLSNESELVRLDALTDQYEKLRLTERKCFDRVILEEAAVRAALGIHAESRRDLQAHLDSEASGAVFRKLDPSCCPRCELEIDAVRRSREKLNQLCSLCGTSIKSDFDADTVRQELEYSVIASRAALDKSTNRKIKAELDYAQCKQDSYSIDTEIKSLIENQILFQDRYELEMEVARLEARLDESKHEEPIENSIDPDGTIIEALILETEPKVQMAQKDLLREVSNQILRYANAFGMVTLTSANLMGNLNLAVIKGGQKMWYSSLTDGEKLRLKVAATLAMISVANRRGIGRHPGLLMIDSPSAQEVSPTDLNALIAGLEEVTNDLQHLQVFVAGTSAESLRRCVAPKRLRSARGDDYLW